MTDARGVVKSYTYNSRGLVSLIHYTVPQGTNPALLPLTADTAFEYDAVGNRISMQDGLGSVTYQYDSLSQMTSETRSLTDWGTMTFTIEYSYTLSGGLKSYKIPLHLLTINYTHDKIGRLKTVVGTETSGTTNYASNAQYRAWGALKHLEYGNGTKFDITGFNNKLQGTNFEAKDANNTAMIKKQYEFYNDGSLRYSQDELNAKFDRLYKYDHLSRMKEAKTGAEARGQTDTPANIPYSQTYSYDAFGHISQTQSKNYSSPQSTVSTNYVNNRRDFNSESSTNGDDEEGYPKGAEGAFGYYIYDASGKIAHIDTDCGVNCTNGITLQSFIYDGDGYLVKKTSTERYGEQPPTTENTYDIRSTVLGKEVILTAGAGGQTYIRANGTVIANGSGQNTIWKHRDPGMSSLRSSRIDGSMITELDGSEHGRLELDPQGNNAGLEDWWANSQYGTPDPTPEYGFEPFQTIRNGQLVRFNVDGIDVPQSFFQRMVEFGFSGTFGGVERQARLSAPYYTVLDIWGLKAYSGGSLKKAKEAAMQTETLTIYRTFNESWALNTSLFSFNTKVIPLPNNLISALKERLEQGDCGKKIQELITQLRKTDKDDKSKSTMIDLLESILDPEEGGGVILAEINGNEKEKAKKLKNLLAGKKVYLRGGVSFFDLEGRRAIEIQNVPYFPDRVPDEIFNSENYVSNTQQNYISTLIHELLHHSRKKGIFSHQNMARAIEAIDNKFKATGDDQKDSQIVSDFLSKYCPATPSK